MPKFISFNLLKNELYIGDVNCNTSMLSSRVGTARLLSVSPGSGGGGGLPPGFVGKQNTFVNRMADTHL